MRGAGPSQAAFRQARRTPARAAEAPPGVRARIIWSLSVCIYGTEENEHLMEISEECVVLARQAGDRHAEANAVGMVGFAALQLGELDRARRLLEESLAILREMELDWNISQILNHLAVPPLQQGHYGRAADCALEALEITERTGGSPAT